jgi:hypothetical protein
VALFDTATDTEIDTGVDNDDDVLGIPLPIKNPLAIQYLEENETIYVQGAGNYFATPPEYTGGIATINKTTYETERWWMMAKPMETFRVWRSSAPTKGI